MVLASLGRLLGVGAVGGAAYTAGYSHKSADQMGEWAEGVSTMSQEVGQGVGAILGSVRDGFSQARSAPPPAPTITHVYHDRGSEKSSLVPILVVTAGGVTCYWVVCWYKGWDFFGMSHARTQELINNFNAKFQQYAEHAKGELQKLREQMSKSEEAQQRHADTLKSVEGLVEKSNVELSDVNLKSEDIARALERNAASSEAQQRGMMAIQYFLASVAAGGVEDKEQAMKILEQSFKDLGATLPSNLLQESERQRLENGNTRPDATGSSSSIAAAISRGSQLVTAPVRSIASYLWPSTDPSGDGAYSQPQVAAPPSSLPTKGASPSSSGAGSLSPPDSTPQVVESQGKSAVRGFGPGGRIPRDTAYEVVSPGGSYGQRSKSRSTLEELDDDGPWRTDSRDATGSGEQEDAVSFPVKRPVFF